MKSTNEELFDRIMRLPHELRGQMMEATMEYEGRFSGRPPMPPHGFARPMPHHEGNDGFARPMPFRDRDNEDPVRPLPFPGGHRGNIERAHENPPRRAPGPGMLNRERVLEILLDGEEEGMRQKDIAQQLRVNPSSTSEFIALLESNGYVTRKIDPNDRRATLIALTELGRARALELKDERDARFGRMFANLTDDEKRQLIALLDKLMPKRENKPQETHLV